MNGQPMQGQPIGQPFAGPGGAPVRDWQHSQPSTSTTEISRTEEAQRKEQEKGLSRVGKLVLLAAIAVMVIAGIMLGMIWLWSRGFFLALFEDPALSTFLQSLA